MGEVGAEGIEVVMEAEEVVVDERTSVTGVPSTAETAGSPESGMGTRRERKLYQQPSDREYQNVPGPVGSR